MLSPEREPLSGEGEMTGDATMTLFLGDLSFFCTEEDLVALFSPFGRVLNVRVRRGVSGESLMHGFIALDSAEAAQQAIAQLDGMEYMGRNIRVQLSSDGQRPPSQAKGDLVQVHVSFISRQTTPRITEQVLREIFSVHGHVADVAVKKHQIVPKQQRQSGYGFVYFTDAECACRALRALKHSTVQNITLDCSISHKSENAMRHTNTQAQTHPHTQATGSHSPSLSRSSSFNHTNAHTQAHNITQRSHTSLAHNGLSLSLPPPPPPPPPPSMPFPGHSHTHAHTVTAQRTHTTAPRTLSTGSLLTHSHAHSQQVFAPPPLAHSMSTNCIGLDSLSLHTPSSHMVPPPRPSPRTNNNTFGNANSFFPHSHKSLAQQPQSSSRTQSPISHAPLTPRTQSLLRVDSDVSIGSVLSRATQHSHTTHTLHSSSSGSSFCVSTHSLPQSPRISHHTLSHTSAHTAAPPQLTVPALASLNTLYDSSPHNIYTQHGLHTQYDGVAQQMPSHFHSHSHSQSFVCADGDALFTLSHSHSHSQRDLTLHHSLSYDAAAVTPHTHSFTHTPSFSHKALSSHKLSETSLLGGAQRESSLSWLYADKATHGLGHAHTSLSHNEDDLDFDPDEPLTVDLAGILDSL